MRLHWGPLWRNFGAAGDAAQLRAGVEAWRRDLDAALEGRLTSALQWDEAAEEFGVVDLGPHGLQALRLWAVYAQRSELEWPDTVPATLELDRHWRAAVDAGFANSHFGQLLAASCWLPGDFEFTCRHPLPDGSGAEIGSLVVLTEQLKRLNLRTFQGGEEALLAWRQSQSNTPELIAAARRGLACAIEAGERAVAACLPLLVVEDGGRP